MDKNTIIGFLLMAAILIGFTWLNQPSEAERQKWQHYQDSLAAVEQHRVDSLRALAEASADVLDTTTANDSAKIALKAQKYGLLAGSVSGEERQTVLENGLIRVELTNVGGKISNVVIKEHKAYGGSPVRMFSEEGDKSFGFTFVHNNRYFNTDELHFSPSDVSVDADSTQSVSFTLPIGEGGFVYTYTLAKGAYEVGLSVEGKDLDDKIAVQGNSLELEWTLDMPAQEKGHKSEGMWSNLCYRYADGDVEEMSATGKDDDEVNMSLDWVAYKDQFFSSILQAKAGFAGASLNSSAYPTEHQYIKNMSSKLGVKFDLRKDDRADFRFLFLPNYFYTLDSYEGMELTDLLPLGWGIFGWINEYFIIPVFKLLENAFSNYGIIILILTVIIKLIIFPFTMSSYKSQAKMRVLKPQIDAINAKYPPEKAMERQQATMALYKKAGINPMGGCLPMLLQMPILFAAFRFFPAAIELRGESFLWADDLSAYDSILDLPFNIPFYGDHVSLFCLLMCVTQILYTKFTMQSQNSAQMPGMNVMMYMMPVMLLFFFNDYPSGLCYYYFLSSLITILLTTLIKRFFVDEKAILAQIESNKKKPVKKSRWQELYERKMKELEQQQRRK